MNIGNKKTILLVEDEAITAMNEKQQLEQYGYSVYHVTTGEKAVQTITDNTYPVDLILMDIDLGNGIDGTQAAEQILSHKDIPVVFLSSHTEPELVEKTEKITSYGYVVKHSGSVVLDASIKMALKLFNEKMARKQKEEELRKSEYKYQMLFENMNVSFALHEAIYDDNGNPVDYRYLDMNPMFLNNLGCKASEIRGHTAKELFPNTEQYWIDLFGKVAKTGESVAYQNYSSELNQWFNTFVFSPQKNQFASFFIDITAQKSAEEALKESEFRKRSYFEQAPYGVFISNNKGEYLEVNPKACELTGYSEKELTKMRITDFLLEKDIELGLEHFRKLKESGNSYGEFRFLTKDGTIRWWSVASTKISDDLLLGFCEDITERKNTEMKLAESEVAIRNKLKAITEPESDLGELDLAEIIDIPAVQSLMENFYNITGCGGAIVDSNGKVIVGVDFKDICAKFHRCHPETEKNCVESDTILASNITPGTFKSYHCKNGMWDMAAPIVVFGRHMGNIYFGQFFYAAEEPDEEYFRNQARLYGFDEVEYLAALSRVPRYDREKVENIITFYSKLGEMISALSFSNISLSRTLTERQQMEMQLQKAKDDLQIISDNMLDLVSVTDMEGNFKFAGSSHKILGYEIEYLIGKNVMDFVHPDDLPGVQGKFVDFITNNKSSAEAVYRNRCADGSYLWFETIGTLIPDNNGNPKEILFNTRDITERKEAEQKLINLQELFKKTEKIGNIGGWEFDVATMTQTWTEETFHLMEIDTTHGEPKVPDGIGFIDQPFRNSAEKALQDAIQKGKGYDQEWRITTAKGNKRWVHAVANATMENGKVVSVSGSFQDISERKQAEKALREQHDFAESLIETAQAIILVLDTQGRIVRFNSYMEHLAGYDLDEVKGKDWFRTFIKPDNGNTVKSVFAKAVDDIQTLGHVNPIIAKDGRKIIVEWYDKTLKDKDGRTVGLLAIGQDITERKQAENELIQTKEKTELSEKKLKEAQHIAHMGNWELNIEANELYWSDEIYRIFDCEPQEFKATYDAFLEFIHPDDREMVNSAYLKSLETKKEYQIEHRVLTKNNQIKYVREKCRTTFNEQGKPLNTFGIVIDITNQKRLEELRENINKQKQTSQRLETIGTLAGGIAHDFNNILTPILGYSGLIKKHFEKDKRLYEEIDEIYKAGLRAKDLISQILNFSRQSKTNKVPLKIHLILKEAIKLMRPTMPAIIDLKTNVDKECRPVMVDGSKIHQVFINICTNAGHAIGEKPGTIAISMKEVTAEEEQLLQKHDIQQGNFCKLIFSDTGCGIEQSIIDRIFDPFFTTKEQGKGTGLGLSVVHGIVKEHDGHIFVESEPGEGTTFYIYLPVVEEEDDDSVHDEEEQDMIKGSENILVVDDRPEVIRMANRMLSALGYNITAFSDPEEAYQYYRENAGRVDLLFSDYSMPKMSGLDLAKKIRAITLDIPVIIATGNTVKLDQKEIVEIGINKVINKPLMIFEVSKTIREILDYKNRENKQDEDSDN